MTEQKVQAILKQVAAGTITRTDAAKALDISERQLNRIMRRHNVTRPPSKVHAAREAAGLRKQIRLAAAIAVVNNEMTIEQAAAESDCSERTIYRYMDKLQGPPSDKAC
jgi:transposase